jgi:hypothetical protein
MTAGPAPPAPVRLPALPPSHGSEISLAIQILTCLSHLILILISCHLISHLINVIFVSYFQFSSFLVYFCRRTTFISLFSSRSLLPNRKHAIHRPCSSVPRGCCLCCSHWYVPISLFISIHLDNITSSHLYCGSSAPRWIHTQPHQLREDQWIMKLTLSPQLNQRKRNLTERPLPCQPSLVPLLVSTLPQSTKVRGSILYRKWEDS